MITMWGYEMPEIEVLPEMLTVEEFDEYTGGQYKDADRVNAEMTAAAAAIRNYVGWHLYPSESCKLSTIMMDRRITRVGSDLLIQLPARVVTSVESILIGGVTPAAGYVEQNGLIRVFDMGYVDRRATVEIEYTAGLDESMMAPVKELISHRVTHAVAIPSGITSEASGGVSVTYNANWINNSRATALAADNREVLIPYKVQGVF